MQLQSITSKLGEISYRAKIVNQHLGRTNLFNHEPNASEFKKILTKRLKEAEIDFRKLKRRGLIKSPYLEIGAEYGLTSCLLENKFAARGFACDISLASLTKSSQFAKKFKFKKKPQFVCADAYTLPFKSNSIPFIFLYETLHHFPDPKPVLGEVKRVLSPGGVCFIGSDPIKQALQINLWRRPTKLRAWEKLLKFTLILPFISHIGKTEVDHGILEEAFPLNVWQRALLQFDKVESTIESPLGFSQTMFGSADSNWLKPNFLLGISLFLLGGGLEAICYKSEKYQKTSNNLNDLLICPNCLKSRKREISIEKTNHFFACPTCRIQYKKYKGVLVLLGKNLEEKILL